LILLDFFKEALIFSAWFSHFQILLFQIFKYFFFKYFFFNISKSESDN
jgi:hypothetical protein